MEIKLHQITVKGKKKTYTYLCVRLSRVVMQNFKPTSIRLNTKPEVVLQINKRKDGKGYAILPCEIIAYFGFVKGQKVEISLILKKN